MPASKKIFITGIPTAGKSYLAKKLADEIGGEWYSDDDMHRELVKDPRFKKWVNFYWDQDEKTYYTSKDYEEQWQDLVKQSEGLWPGILERIAKFKNYTEPVIFEGVNILPHLAKKDLNFPGIVLLGKSFEEVLERNRKNPRWGKTEELQRLEAEEFFYGEREYYKKEAEKYGYPVFESADDAYKYALDL